MLPLPVLISVAAQQDDQEFLVNGSVKPRLLILQEPHEITLRRIRPLEQVTDLQIARTQNELAALMPDAEIIFVWESAGPWLRQHWKHASRLKWVHFSGVGMESLLFPEFVESDVALTNTRGYYSNSLAEFAIAAIFYFAKGFPRLQQNKLERGWNRFLMTDIQGQTVGILGLGNIGMALARKAKALGMRVLAHKRQFGPGLDQPNVDRLIPRESLHELFTDSDYVVNTLPLTPATLKMIGANEFQAMRRTSYFINVGRGQTTDEEALLQCLREQTIGGAALDVFCSEPLPASSEFYTLPNVLISPHCCDLTLAYYENTALSLMDNVERYLAGKPLLNLVDKTLGY
jgi:phosphoglycerate dehydrogenase-like enzyme